MRFKEFLAEQAQTITAILHPYELLEWMKDSRKYLERGNFIFRGADFSQSGRTGMFHGRTTGVRTSANTANYYTLWIDNADGFKGYPKRSKSFICSTSKQYASSFGEIALVIPKDNSHVAGVGETDIWGIEVGPTLLLNDLNVMTAELFNDILGKEANTWEEMVDGCKRITTDLIKQKISNDELETLAIADYLTVLEKHKVKNLYDMWDKYFVPADFSLTTVGQFNDTKNQEVWIQDDCMFINLVHTPSDEDMEILLEFAEDFPKLKELLEEVWNPEDTEHIDSSNVSDEDTLTFSQKRAQK